jgi:hypothetical protein
MLEMPFKHYTYGMLYAFILVLHGMVLLLELAFEIYYDVYALSHHLIGDKCGLN